MPNEFAVRANRIHRRQLIDPKLKEAGWEVVEGSSIITERYFTNGRLTQSEGRLCHGMTMFDL